MISANIGIGLGVILPIVGAIVKSKLPKEGDDSGTLDVVITWIVGLLFGCGLLVSGMVRRINIIKFLGMH